MESTAKNVSEMTTGDWWVEKTIVKGRPDRESGP
jgi:hypothetical protein